MRYAYYPGCSLSSTGKEYDMSTRAVAKALDVELWEIPEWNCCGATSAHTTDHLLGLALPARNLAIAEEAGLDVAVPCANCFSRLKVVEKTAKENPFARKEISEVIEMKLSGTSTVKNIADVFLNEVGLDKVQEKVEKPLTGLKVAAYYGCLYVKPPKVANFDNPEYPESLDKLITALGGTPVPWSHKTECCGASLSVTKTDVGLKMIDEILKHAKEAGADCVATPCPMCTGNLDMRQGQITRELGKQYDLPIFYFTQLMGLAMGCSPKELGINKHFVNPANLLKEKSLV